MNKVKNRLISRFTVSKCHEVAITPKPSKSEVSIKNVSEIIKEYFPALTPIDAVYLNAQKLRINLCVDILSNNIVISELSVSLIFAILLTNEFSCQLRIITRNELSNLSGIEEFCNRNNIQIPKDIIIANFALSGTKQRLERTENDIFIATSWWSALVIKKLNLRKKYIYLITEYEPLCYSNGDEHVLIRSILDDRDMMPIINTKVLLDYFIINNYNTIKDKGIYFEPSFPNMLSRKNNSYSSKGKSNLFFYACPSISRNMFHTGLLLIDKAIEQGLIDANQWTIYFFSEDDLTPIVFSDGTVPQYLGKMTLHNYTEFAPSIDLAITLMMAPSLGYLSLELAAAGAVVLTTNYANKRNLDYSKNIFWSEPSVEDLLDKLKQAIALIMNEKARNMNYLTNKIFCDWNESFKPILNKLTPLINSNIL